MSTTQYSGTFALRVGWSLLAEVVLEGRVGNLDEQEGLGLQLARGALRRAASDRKSGSGSVLSSIDTGVWHLARIPGRSSLTRYSFRRSLASAWSGPIGLISITSPSISSTRWPSNTPLSPSRWYVSRSRCLRENRWLLVRWRWLPWLSSCRSSPTASQGRSHDLTPPAAGRRIEAP